MYTATGSVRSCFPGTLLRRCAAARLKCSAAANTTGSSAMPLTGHVPGFLRVIAEVNNGLPALTSGKLVPFTIDGQQLGYLRPEYVQQLLAHPAVFQLQSGQSNGQQQQQQDVLTIAPELSDMQRRSDAVAGVLSLLREQGMFSGWRNELYPVTAAFDAEPALLLERAAAPYFGIRAYGVHINGYTVAADGTKRLWVARRSATKQTWPGKLDHIVAGGQPYGLSCADNVVKECWEEAGIPKELAAAAVPVGFVSYVSMTHEGLKPDVLFCYDLQLPENFVPKPQDGEVQEFMLWDMEHIASVISSSDEYKPNCCLVIIDFLVRHGLLAPEEPGYIKLVHQLRVGDPV